MCFYLVGALDSALLNLLSASFLVLPTFSAFPPMASTPLFTNEDEKRAKLEQHHSLSSQISPLTFFSFRNLKQSPHKATESKYIDGKFHTKSFHCPQPSSFHSKITEHCFFFYSCVHTEEWHGTLLFPVHGINEQLKARLSWYQITIMFDQRSFN